MLSTTCLVPKGARLETTGPNCTSFRTTVVLMELWVKDLRSHLKLLSELHLVTSSCRTLRRCRQLSAGQTLSGDRCQNSPRGAKPSGWRATHHNAGFSPFHALILPIVPQLSQPRVPKGFKRPRDIASPPVCKARGVSTSARFHCVFPPPNSQSEPSGPERHRSLSPHAASTAS